MPRKSEPSTRAAAKINWRGDESIERAKSGGRAPARLIRFARRWPYYHTASAYIVSLPSPRESRVRAGHHVCSVHHSISDPRRARVCVSIRAGARKEERVRRGRLVCPLLGSCGFINSARGLASGRSLLAEYMADRRKSPSSLSYPASARSGVCVPRALLGLRCVVPY